MDIQPQPLDSSLDPAADRSIGYPSADFVMLVEVLKTAVRRHRLPPDQADDFIQSVHVRLLERNYDVFERFAGRSSLKTYLTKVVDHLLLDWRNQQYGKWRPSAAAARLGACAVDLERHIFRDDRARGEAVEIVAQRRRLPTAAVEAVLACLPYRVPRAHLSDSLIDTMVHVEFDDPLTAAEDAADYGRVYAALRHAVRRLPVSDRHLLSRRFDRASTIRRVARERSVDPRLLYRRLQCVLSRLRRDLHDTGVTRVPKGRST